MEHCDNCLHKKVCENFRNNICYSCKKRHQEFVVNENGTCGFYEDKTKYIKISPINVGDYLWTDVGEDEVIIDKVKVVSVTQTENGYDICLGEGLGENYRITEEDIDNDYFFRTEELAIAKLKT